MVSPRPRVNKTGFPKTKGHGFSPPYLIYVIFFYGRGSLPGCKQHMKVLVWIFSAQYGPRIKFQKVGRNFTSFGRGYSLGLHKISEKFSRNSFFLKFHVRISFKFGTKRNKFQVKRMSIRPRKNQTVSHINEPSFHSWQWWIKNLLPILWDEYRAQIYAKTQ